MAAWFHSPGRAISINREHPSLHEWLPRQESGAHRIMRLELSWCYTPIHCLMQNIQSGPFVRAL